MSIDVLQPAENFVSQLRDPETLIVKKKGGFCCVNYAGDKLHRKNQQEIKVVRHCECDKKVLGSTGHCR